MIRETCETVLAGFAYFSQNERRPIDRRTCIILLAHQHLTRDSPASAVHDSCRLEDRCIHKTRRRMLEHARKPRLFVPTASERDGMGQETTRTGRDKRRQGRHFSRPLAGWRTQRYNLLRHAHKRARRTVGAEQPQRSEKHGTTVNKALEFSPPAASRPAGHGLNKIEEIRRILASSTRAWSLYIVTPFNPSD